MKFTTTIAVDAFHVGELELSWPTWTKFRPEIADNPLLVMVDAARTGIDEWESRLRFLNRDATLVPYKQPGVIQRERMLTALVRAAEYVETDYLLKIDTDVIAHAPATWLKPEFFTGQIAATSHAKSWPCDVIDCLDDWADGVDDLKKFKRLDLPFDPEAEEIRHKRIISWVFFGETKFCSWASRLCPGRLPTPSHDTFLWYVAKRSRKTIRFCKMSKLRWGHYRKFEHLSTFSEKAMAR